MARSDEQYRQARERTRESILQAAIAAFSERGVAGASIAEITTRAGVAQGLVNYHFGGKERSSRPSSIVGSRPCSASPGSKARRTRCSLP